MTSPVGMIAGGITTPLLVEVAMTVDTEVATERFFWLELRIPHALFEF
jgi:hypothetical protein